MKRLWRSSLFVSGIFLLALSVTAQTPTPSPTPAEDEDVVVITTNLVKIDATVTDKNGKIVTDLKAEDFEIFENNQKQEITDFSFVTLEPAKNVEATVKPNAEKNQAPAPPVPTNLRPERVRRTIALVVDDLGLSFQSVAYVRIALKKFVDEQMQPGDLVAIIRTGGGVGALQQFTSDKRVLYAAIEKVRWNPQGRGKVGVFAPIESAESLTGEEEDESEDSAEQTNQNRGERATEQLRDEVFSVGTLGALSYIVKGMGELPGRKAAVLFSDGFRLFNRDEDGFVDSESNRRVLETLRRLTDQANRASVVINAVDPRGLQYTGFTAADSPNAASPDALNNAMRSRGDELFDTQEGLKFLADETGGRSFVNNNDISGAIEKVLDDQKGYYLLGYQPDSDTFDPKTRRFNKIIIKVKRPGLSVRFRSGFFGVTDEALEKAPTNQTPQQQLFGALTSPFGASGVNVKLVSLFANEAAAGSFVSSFLHIDGRDLQFTDEPNGLKKADFDIVAMTFGDNGLPVDQVNRSYTVRVKAADVGKIAEQGFVYYLTVPIKKPGAYQLRIAMRDMTSARVGAASQFIEVPDLKKNRLTVSGIVLENMTSAEWQKFQTGNAADAGATRENSRESTALRRFKRGTVLRYGFVVYNARQNQADKKLNLQYRVRLFRDNQEIFAGRETIADITGQTDLQRIKLGGAISLGNTLAPGNYILQVVADDSAAKEKRRIATQWIDFEVIN